MVIQMKMKNTFGTHTKSNCHSGMIPSGHRRSSDIGDSAYVVMKPGFQKNMDSTNILFEVYEDILRVYTM